MSVNLKYIKHSFVFYTDTVPYQEMKGSASQADALGEKVLYGTTNVLRRCNVF